MGLWKRALTPEAFAGTHAATLPGLLGIRLEEVGEDFARASMPVDERHIQPAGILHGGCSVVLAETLGSTCGVMALEDGWTVVGLEVNANHLAPVFKGDRAEAICRPLQLGRTVQVWQIEIRRGDGTLTCVSRLTTVVRQGRGR
ncbi:hotdog fold thioesterase [Paracraurococcus lichenis]|uniref:Hotdog fold thioesterase n=1 Tax=Paracraurococcus lichenis TaxID=3064888 RepID=A0ABT9E740_9PROT|nr:hotdog fold thioesterase [Paracraurococcus sp. LOR1-02]MDO9712000.1 hotdog fold thioesterase [Paracraurococcus sp. LOR1-02]